MKEEKPLLKLKNVSKFYFNKGIVATGFTKVNLEFNLGEFVVITGESGSGKSTLLNVVSGLDSYEEGEMYINGNETSHYNEVDFEGYRKTYIGNIFQTFNLVSSYTVYQNIELVLLLNGYKKKDVKDKIIDLIKKVDLYNFRNTRVSRLSGGQKQRVAIARALAKDVPIIIADEPTGNLDLNSAASVIKLLSEIAKDKLVIIVTHNYEQVEKYATRKIEMHDGKVREDINLKEYKKGSPEIYKFRSLTSANKIRLGLRNTFNILPKFVLTFLVFLFVIFAFLGQYSSFKKSEYEIKTTGDNGYFKNQNANRIIINKKDRTSISSEELEKIKNLKHVVKVNPDDLIYDSTYSLEGDNLYFYGRVDDIDQIKKIDVGRMPEKANEIVIEGPKNDYYLNRSRHNELFAANLSLRDDSYYQVYQNNIKVVGIVYKASNSFETTFYISKEVFENAKINAVSRLTKTQITFPVNNKERADGYSLNVIPSSLVKKGEAIIANDLNMKCQYSWCNNKILGIDVENIYYKDHLDVKVTGIFSKSNYKKYINDLHYEGRAQGSILISLEDYNNLYNKDTYQTGIYVDDSRNADEVGEKLDEMGYKVLLLKDTYNYDDKNGLLGVLKIFRIITTTVLLIVLFFIAYFIIRLIQKSKNVYYSTVRILGGTMRNVASLIKIELFSIYNITFIISLLTIYLVKINNLKSNYISNLITYLTYKDYIAIYIILFVICFLIASRYSRKLFKSSAMNTYRGEAE